MALTAARSRRTIGSSGAPPAAKGTRDMGFVQIIEYATGRPDEVEHALADWIEASDGRRSTCRVLTTADRDRPERYVSIVRFVSYQAARANAVLPETQHLAEQIAKLCHEPPVYRNLEIIEELDLP